MISVLVVEDSFVARELLVHLLASDAEIQVIGTAADGQQALTFLETRQPDIITMDIHMPHLDGFETTCRIMETRPTPIVMVSANLKAGETELAFRALRAGALDAVEKPSGPGHPDYEKLSRQLLDTVKAMAGVKVIKRWPQKNSPATSPQKPLQVLAASHAAKKYQAVVMGASTGGPPVLQTILNALPADFPLPIAIVQHIAPGFTQGMADWLTQTTQFPVSLALNGETMSAGRAYMAPDNCHLSVDSNARLWLRDTPPENNLRPAVAVLFRAAEVAFGGACIAVLLTGMGRDGAEELRVLKDAGAVTLAQDQASSIVHGMPGEAIKLGAATYVAPPPRIAALLQSLAAQRS